MIMIKISLALAALCVVQVSGMKLFGVEVSGPSQYAKIDKWLQEADLPVDDFQGNLLKATAHFKEIKSSIEAPQELKAWQQFTDLTKTLPDLRKCTKEEKSILDTNVKNSGLTLPAPAMDSITSPSSKIVADLLADHSKACKGKQ